MLLFQNGCFYSEKVSIQIPDGFYFEDDPEMTGEYGLCAWSPRKDYICSWKFYNDCEGSVAELEKWLTPDFGCSSLSAVTPIQINDLPGHFLLYKDHRHQYYEARFDLGEGEELAFLVEARYRDIRQVVESPVFQAALNGIKFVK